VCCCPHILAAPGSLPTQDHINTFFDRNTYRPTNGGGGRGATSSSSGGGSSRSGNPVLKDVLNLIDLTEDDVKELLARKKAQKQTAAAPANEIPELLDTVYPSVPGEGGAAAGGGGKGKGAAAAKAAFKPPGRRNATRAKALRLLAAAAAGAVEEASEGEEQ
jgi:hypothetical protein